MTTRVWSIAEKCETEQGARVYEQEFGRAEAERLSAMILMSKSVEGTNAKELSTKIAYRLDLCPLAVICFSSAWAESHHHVQVDDAEWDTWARHILDDGFLSTPALKPLVQSLCLGFDDLPVQLKTCLLYSTIYLKEYKFYKEWLVRKWIAEGFVSQVEVAEAYFDKLVYRNLLWQGEETSHVVNGAIKDFLVCKAKEDNFISSYDGGPGNTSHAKQIRRLSLSSPTYYGWRGNTAPACPDEDVLSHTRTLSVSNMHSLHSVPFKAFKKLRVLQINKSCNLEDDHLVDICGLIWLKYLSLRGTGVRELPKEIRKLQHLRTLDIRDCKVRELPWEVENSINVHFGDPRSPKILKLGEEAVSSDWVISSSGANCRGALSIVLADPFNWRYEPLQVPLLRIDRRHVKVPQWVKQDLCNVCSLDIRLCILVHEDLEFLKTQMPNLQALQLRFEVLPRKPVIITAGGFPKLETFYVDCRLPQVITFGEGAMPNLKHLQFKFYTGTASRDYYMGIKHLVSLEVVFLCSWYYTSDGPGIRETIDVLRKEAVEHPKEITLWVNDMDPEVFGRDALRGISLAIAEKREKLSRAAERRSFLRERRGVPFVN
uniref:NB-ARC domain-containing protein n=3 Tax=Setaria italica TaxID=4555 RepID=K3ZHT2_SETIT